MNNLIYEQWHFPRPILVDSYLAMLRDGPGDPIALQSPRRWGKTTFLLAEILPAARTAGLLPVYIDVWQNRSDVLSAINYGLQEAIDDLDVPTWQRKRQAENPSAATPTAPQAEGEDKYDIPAFLRKHVN